MGQKLTIVIGAGASKEVNLPTGAELKKFISRDLSFRASGPFGEIENGDSSILQALRIYCKDTNFNMQQIIDAAGRITHSLPQAKSIDNFIDQHRDDKCIEICGKLAIVRSILHEESKCLLKEHKTGSPHILNANDYSQTWLTSFWQTITENCSKGEVSSRFNDISLIVFNYDRCVEHYLYHTLQSFYGFTDTEAANLVNNINIFHPYGVVGYLPWQNKKTDTISFGEKPSHMRLLSLAKTIKTFTEGTDPESSEILMIREAVRNAKTLVFLGFGFHKLNLDLIAPKDLNPTTYSNQYVLKIFATTQGISNSNIEDIRKYIGHLGEQTNMFFRSDLTCYDLFHEFAWKLSP